MNCYSVHALGTLTKFMEIMLAGTTPLPTKMFWFALLPIVYHFPSMYCLKWDGLDWLDMRAPQQM
jgi:hypothetical protein